ncbi:MAG: hypothetical protein Q9213_007065 [Squamulea squamosa]
MSNHANEELRCEQQDPRPEGIAAEKMELITSKRGATWADIYSIIFPGAPVPSPYNDYDFHEQPGGQSPQSQELANFEVYSCMELPRLVEADLQSRIDAHVVSLEESLRRMLVDIVSSCQSTLAQNYRRIHTTLPIEMPPADDGQLTATSPLNAIQAIDDNTCATSQNPQDSLESRGQFDNFAANIFEEPPFLGQGEGDFSFNPNIVFPEDFDPFDIPTDSGYRIIESHADHCTSSGQAKVLSSDP